MAFLCLATAILLTPSPVSGRGLGRLVASNPESDQTLVTLSARSPRSKRALYDSSCKGFYDQDLFHKLERVCDDCYNLYRKSHVVTDCRMKCFNTRMFEVCAISLGLDVEEYLEDAFRIREDY
uniref:CHH1L preproprotein n=1 Tax=Glyptonotus antarcticus TaxID=104130 RepID=A0A1W5LUG3_9CRUS|nr:CHH1L preproprotein [Glyptonotus antarcticus]